MRWQQSLAFIGLTVGLGGWLGGCGAAPDPGGNPGGSELPEGSAAPQVADMQTLEIACAQYVSLCATQPAIDARVALVDALNDGVEGVASAGMANDNYTIMLAYENGAHAALNTIEGFGAGEPYDPEAMAGKIAAAYAKTPAARPHAVSAKTTGVLTGPAPGDLKHTPTSRKILFMSAASEDLDGADMDLFESLTTKLVIENNWDLDDITIKTNTAADDYATLQFDDFFDLDRYGVIMIVAHGLYMDITGSGSGTTGPGGSGAAGGGSGTSSSDGPDPFNFGFRVIQSTTPTPEPHYFIQVAAAGPVVRGAASGTPGASGGSAGGSDPFDFGFKPIVPLATLDAPDIELETARGRLLIVAHTSPHVPVDRPYYYMRDDLWKERVSTLPNSLVYVASPNGYADADAAWPDVSAADPDPGAGDPPPADADPFNFGFRLIRTTAATAPRCGAGLVFEGSDAGTLLSWTGAVDTQTALDAAWMMAFMAGRNQSDREVWNSGDIKRAAARSGVPRTSSSPPPSTVSTGGSDPYGFGFRTMTSPGDMCAQLALHSKTENAFLYLPTWIDVTALEPIPDGTLSMGAFVEYADPDNPGVDPDTRIGDPTDTLSFDGLIPGQVVTVIVEALDGASGAISTFETTITLQSGGNDVEASFTRELSVTLSGSPDDDGDWGDREDLDNKHGLHCTGFRMMVYKNGEALSPNRIDLRDRWVAQSYPPLHLISHDKILIYSGWNPAYPGDTIALEFLPDPNDGISAIIGPMYLHYWNDTTHEVIDVGSVSALAAGPSVTRTFTLGK